MNNQIPKYVLKNAGCKTTREFKQLKRRQVREAKKAVNELMKGAVHLPSLGLGLVTAYWKLEAVERELSIEEWGR